MPKQHEENRQGGYSSDSRGGSDNLSEAARKMRSNDPEERREGASEMGHVGGQNSHGGHGSKRSENESSNNTAA